MKNHWPITILTSISSIFLLSMPLILVRVMPPTELGAYKIFFLYLTVLPAFTLISGVSSGLAYWAGRGPIGLAAIRTSSLVFLALSLLTFSVILLFQNYISEVLNLDVQRVHLLAFAAMFGIASLFYDEAAIATGRVWTGAFFISGFEILRAAVVVIVALRTESLQSILIAHIVISALKVSAGFLLAFRQDLFTLNWERIPKGTWRGIFRYALPISIAFLFGFGINYWDQLILSRTLSVSEFATYAICCLTVQPLLVLEASVARVLVPKMSERMSERKGHEAVALYREAVSEISRFTLPAIFGMIIFAEPIIELLFTKTYLSGTSFLQLYSLWYLGIMIPPDALARSRGDGNWILKSVILFSCLTFLLVWSLSQKWGAIGALMGLISARMCSRVYSIYYMKKKMECGVSDLIPVSFLLKTAAICGILACFVLPLRGFFQSGLQWFLITGTFFTGAYFLMAWAYLSHRTQRGELKVLMITPGLFIGGLEKMIFNLSSVLKQSSSWVPEVIAYDFAPDVDEGKTLLGLFEQRGIKVHSRKKPARFSLKTVFWISQSVRERGISVLHTHDLGALIYGVLTKWVLLGRIRIVHTQHSFVNLGRSWKIRYYEWFFAHFADQIVAVSEDTKNNYVDLGFDAKKIETIPNGVNFVRRHRELMGHLELRFELAPSVPARDFWILYLARVDRGKGQDHALEVWSAMDPKLRRQSSLIFVGPESDAPTCDNLRVQIKNTPDSEKIFLLGPSLTPEKWLEVADVFLSCSEYEGMPLGPLEALGAGVPIVVSNIPGHEFLSRTELGTVKTFLIERPDLGARSLESIFSKSKSDPLAFRKSAWEMSRDIRQKFSLDKMSAQYQRIYEVSL